MASARQRRYSKRRQMRVKSADNDLTETQWQQILSVWGHSCAYCGQVAAGLQKDCVQAISRGGRYTFSNVVPACAPCNASKCNAEVTSWMRRKKLDEPRFLERWSAVLKLPEN